MNFPFGQISGVITSETDNVLSALMQQNLNIERIGIQTRPGVICHINSQKIIMPEEGVLEFSYPVTFLSFDAKNQSSYYIVDYKLKEV